jgi:YHS domain-containing protein
MSTVDTLLSRIDAEFKASESKQKQFQEAKVQQYRERDARLAKLEQVFQDLRDLWRPRLEALATKFGEGVKVTPTVSQGARQATFRFQSPLARIDLRISAGTDSDVTKVMLTYDLNIVPILMQFEKHAEISFPLDSVDRTALAEWLDDRIVAFVKTYLALQQNEYYLKDFMVEDPIAHVRFPKFAAGATLERSGKVYYFVSTRRATPLRSKPLDRHRRLLDHSSRESDRCAKPSPVERRT